MSSADDPNSHNVNAQRVITTAGHALVAGAGPVLTSSSVDTDQSPYDVVATSTVFLVSDTCIGKSFGAAGNGAKIRGHRVREEGVAVKNDQREIELTAAVFPEVRRSFLDRDSAIDRE